MLGYTPASNGGGVNASDIETIGGFGGMNVVHLNGGSGGLSISSSTGTVVGGSYNDYRVMMTFPGAGGIDHAVVVTGTSVVNGVTRIHYHDPTTGNDSFRENGDYTSLYGVGAVGTATPYLGGS